MMFDILIYDVRVRVREVRKKECPTLTFDGIKNNGQFRFNRVYRYFNFSICSLDLSYLGGLVFIKR